MDDTLRTGFNSPVNLDQVSVTRLRGRGGPLGSAIMQRPLFFELELGTENIDLIYTGD